VWRMESHGRLFPFVSDSAKLPLVAAFRIWPAGKEHPGGNQQCHCTDCTGHQSRFVVRSPCTARTTRIGPTQRQGPQQAEAMRVGRAVLFDLPHQTIIALPTASINLHQHPSPSLLLDSHPIPGANGQLLHSSHCSCALPTTNTLPFLPCLRLLTAFYALEEATLAAAHNPSHPRP
jgi:hypothetical protein